MFNVTILKMKDIKKYAIGMLLTAVIIITVSRYFPKIIQQKANVPQWIIQNSMVGCLEQTVPAMSSIKEEEKKIEKEENTEEKILQGILKTQIGSMQVTEDRQEKEQAVIEEETEEIKQGEEKIGEEKSVELARKQFINTSNYQ